MEPITTNTSSSAPSSPSSSSIPTSPSLKQKLKVRYQSSCFPSPFRKTNHHHESLPAFPHTPKLFRTSSIEIRDKCKNFISRISRTGSGRGYGHGNVPPNGRSHHHRRHSIAADFRYDAMSYALNFDEGNSESAESEFHIRSFSARLPESPKRDVVIEVI